MSFEKIGILLPGIATVALAACVGFSLVGYSVPVLGEEPEAAETSETAATSAAAATVTAAESAPLKGKFELDDGVYRGTGVGYSGDVVVDVNIKEKSITAIDVVEESDTAEFFNMAKASVIPAIIEQQSYEVDGVTGATYSSRGIKNAVRNAITGEVDNSERGDGLSDTDSISAAAGLSASSGGTAASLSSITEGTFEDGTYTGSAQGYSGTTTVRVVVEGSRIKSITVLSHGDTSSYFNRATAVISSMISGNTTNVSAVSGATYSSNGIINAVRNALQGHMSGSSGTNSSGSNSSGTGASSNEASSGSSTVTIDKVTEDAGYTDGTYDGEGTGYDGGTTKVRVTISDGKIARIDLLSNEDTEEYFNLAKETLIGDGTSGTIITKQTTNVDAVSNATYSSRGIIEAVRDALSKAAQNEKVDRTGFNLTLELAESVYTAENEKKYTPSSWKQFLLALADAKLVSHDSDASQNEIDAEDSSLDRAMRGLTKRANEELYKEGVGILQNEINGLTESDYTAESWQTLQDALQEAENLKFTEETSQYTANNLLAALRNARNGLVSANAPVYTYMATTECAGGDEEDFDYWITTTIHMQDGKIIQAEAESQDIDDGSKTYFDYAVNGRTRTKDGVTVTYASVLQQMVDKQSVDGIDTVSGATYTSEAIIEGAKQALAQTNAATGGSTETSGENSGTTPAQAAADRTGLGSAIALAESLLGEEESYTPSTWNAFSDAIAAAKEIYNAENPTQSDLDNQAASVTNAMNGLVNRADRTLLEAAIRDVQERISSMTASDYTADSWQNLQNALQSAQDTDNNAEATQTDATNAVNALQSALNGLTLAELPVDTYWVTTQCTDGEGGDFDYSIKTTISIQGGRIIKAEAVSEDIDEKSQSYFNYAVNGRTRTKNGVTTTYTSVLQQMVDKQSADDIDIVSGATYTSNAIIDAAKQALQNAGFGQ